MGSTIIPRGYDSALENDTQAENTQQAVPSAFDFDKLAYLRVDQIWPGFRVYADYRDIKILVHREERPYNNYMHQ